MDTLLVSTSIVALAEGGDKTQFQSRLLAVQFKKPSPAILDSEVTHQQGAATTVSRTEGEQL